MDDRILAAADHVTSAGDALFAGEGPDVCVVHDKRMQPGEVWRSEDNQVAVKIIRESSAEEFYERCPHVPAILNLARCFFYVGVAD